MFRDSFNKEQVGWKVRNHASLGMVCSPIFFILSNISFFVKLPNKKNYRIQISKMSAEKYLGRCGGWENFSCRGGGSAFQIHS
jgi:hypothetical protein